ncbi:hypothetical protein Slin15195_G092940 [Neofusicoccum parvum]|uniref:Uncharacterized protein n=1 Tax=Neofusicoccum parvum TaxID=310453 RepID=A0ACB5RN44_9PEZI|nr:hypothetical protein Slin15195_G092940 [Neofusicoccum parvum]
MNFVAVVCWTIAISGTKVSILIQYLRLFRLRKMTRFWYFQSGFEVLTCFIMVSLLVPPFWNLQLPKSKRVGLIILLSLSSS